MPRKRENPKGGKGEMRQRKSEKVPPNIRLNPSENKGHFPNYGTRIINVREEHQHIKVGVAGSNFSDRKRQDNWKNQKKKRKEGNHLIQVTNSNTNPKAGTLRNKKKTVPS